MKATTAAGKTKIIYETTEQEIDGCVNCPYFKIVDVSDPYELDQEYQFRCSQDGHTLATFPDSFVRENGLKRLFGDIHEDCPFLKKNERGGRQFE